MGPMEEDLLVPWKSLTVFQNSLLDLNSLDVYSVSLKHRKFTV